MIFAKNVFTLLAILIIATASTASAQTSQPGPVMVRESDSLLNGALIGAGAGVASGLAFCRLMEPWDVCLSSGSGMFITGAIGAGIGMGVDALIRKRVYQSASGTTELHAAPIIGRRAKGVRLSLRF